MCKPHPTSHSFHYPLSPLPLPTSQKSDLARMYKLFKRIPKGLEPMADIFKKHVEEEGACHAALRCVLRHAAYARNVLVRNLLRTACCPRRTRLWKF